MTSVRPGPGTKLEPRALAYSAKALDLECSDVGTHRGRSGVVQTASGVADHPVLEQLIDGRVSLERNSHEIRGRRREWAWSNRLPTVSISPSILAPPFRLAIPSQRSQPRTPQHAAASEACPD